MKRIFFILILSLIFLFPLFAEVDMDELDQAAKAGDNDKVMELAQELFIENKLYLANKYVEPLFFQDPKNDDAYKITLYFYEQSDKEEEVEKILLKRVEEKSDEKAYLKLGMIYKARNDFDKAYLYFQKAKEINDSDEVEQELKQIAVKKYVAEGEEYFKRKEYISAVDNFSKALKVFPENYELNVKYANALYLVANYDESLKVLNKAVSIKSKRFEAFQLRGIIYSDQGNYSSAISNFKKVVQYKPLNYKSYYKLGEIYYKERAFDLSIRYLKKAETLKKNIPEIYYYRGLAHLKKKEYEDSLTYLKKAQELKLEKDISDLVKDLEVFNYITRANNTKDHDEALSLYKKAVQLKEDPELFTGLGNIYFIKKNYEESEKNYRRALELDSKKIDALKGLSSCLREKGEIEEANTILSELEKLAETDPEINYKFGLLYEKSIEYDKAIKYYEKALILDPEYTQAKMSMGYCYYLKAVKNYTKNKLKNAKKNISKALEIDPLNKDYKDVLKKTISAEKKRKIRKMFRKASRHFKKKEYDQAINFCNKILDINPELESVYYSLGKCYFYKKEYDRSEKIYNKIRIDFPREVDVYLNLGQLYLDQNELDKAEEFFQMYIKKSKEKNRVKGYIGLAKVYNSKRDYVNAEKYYKKVLEKDKKNVKSLVGIGNINFYKQNHDEALTYYKKVLRFSSKNESALYGCGVIYFKRKDFKSAEKYFIKAKRGAKNLGDISFSLGKLYYYKKDYNKALSYFTKVTQTRKDILDKWALGNIYERLAENSPEEKKKLYQKKAYDYYITCLDNQLNPNVHFLAKKRLIYNSPTGSFVNPSRFKSTKQYDVEIDNNIIYSVNSNYNIICFDKFTEEVLWTWDNTLPLSSPFILYNDKLYVGTEKGEVVLLDKKTGELRSRIKEYAKRMFIYDSGLCLVNENNRFVYYKDTKKLFDQSLTLKDFILSKPEQDVLYNKKQINFMDLKSGKLRIKKIDGKISSVFSTIGEIGVLIKDDDESQIKFYSKRKFKKIKELKFDEEYNVADVSFTKLILENKDKNKIVLIDSDVKQIKWEKELENEKIASLSMGNDILYILTYNNEVIVLNLKDASETGRYPVDRKIKENSIYVLFYKSK